MIWKHQKYINLKQNKILNFFKNIFVTQCQTCYDLINNLKSALIHVTIPSAKIENSCYIYKKSDWRKIKYLLNNNINYILKS
jgi:hypothetical protein